MTAANRGNFDDDTHRPSSATHEEVQCCAHDHQHDEGVPDEAESHCGGGCCGDDEGSDCESNADPCEDSCCGHHEDHSVHRESAHEKGQRGTGHIGSCAGRRLTRFTPHQMSVAQPIQLNPSRTIQVAATHRQMGTKIQGRSASVFLMVLMGVSERRCSSRLAADRTEIPPQVRFQSVLTTISLKANDYRNPLGVP